MGRIFTRRRLAGWAYGCGLAALVLASATVIGAGLAPVPERLLVPDSTVVTWRDGQAAHVFLAPDERWRIGTPPEALRVKRFISENFLPPFLSTTHTLETAKTL